jgi:uncharacterized protein (TIGR02284 family)
MNEHIRESNLRQLQKRYEDKLGLQILPEFDTSEIFRRSDIWLKEARIRDEVLKFYSLVELGCLGSVFPKPLPFKFRKRAENELGALADAQPLSDPLEDPSQRLIKLFQARLQDNWGHLDHEQVDATVPLYSQFLATNMVIEENPDAQDFLQCLTDTEAWNRIIFKELFHSETFTNQLFCPDTEQTYIGHLLQGFYEYLAWISNIQDLLNLASEFSLFQSGMWHYHSRVLGNKEAMMRLSMWFTALVPSIRKTGIESVEEWGKETEQTLLELQSEEYQKPILDSSSTINTVTLEMSIDKASADDFPRKEMDWNNLNKYLRNELSVIETYQQALEKERQKLGHETEFQQLNAILSEHQQAASQLRTHIQQLGGTPVQDSGAWGTWSKIVMGAATLLGDKAALKALKEGEESRLKEYQEALQDTDTPPEVKTVINSLLPKQQAHIRTLDELMAKL